MRTASAADERPERPESLLPLSHLCLEMVQAQDQGSSHQQGGKVPSEQRPLLFRQRRLPLLLRQHLPYVERLHWEVVCEALRQSDNLMRQAD